MEEEEVVLLEEQLAEAQADIERLQEALAEATARATTHEAEGAEMRRQLAVARRDIAERQVAMSGHADERESLRAAVTAAEERARLAAGRYRETLLALDPSVPAELLEGDTLETIDESLARARETVAQVRQQMEQAAAAQRVPAGSPARTPPDLSALSPMEKIRAGLEEAGRNQ
jgi:septum formation inhibitor MinC